MPGLTLLLSRKSVCVFCVFVFVSVCVCVCLLSAPRLLTTKLSDIVWTQYDWVNKLYNFYMSAVVSSIDAHHRSQPNEGRLALY